MAVKIIEMLIEYELAVSGLYRQCAEKFSNLKDFWTELADEEIIHAENIMELTDEALAQNAEINERAFAERPVEISIEYAKDITRRVMENRIDLLRVMSLSVDIENSLIESEYHRVFTGKRDDVNNLIKQVHMESMNHRERIKSMKEQVLDDKKRHPMERWD